MEKFRLGIIGTGMRTFFLVNEILRRDELEIVAVSDVSNQSMEMLCSKYERDWIQYTDYKELLKRNDIDAVIIASPDYVHEEQAIAAFEAGKHVFLEKPIAITREGGKKVLQKMVETNKILLIGFVLRYNRLYKKMKELVRSGTIGELKTGWVFHSVGSASDWYFHDWHGTVRNTGGLLVQKGSHDFDMINWIADSKVKKVVAFGSRDYFGGDNANSLICEECKEKNTCPEAIKERILTVNKADGKQTDLFYNQWRNSCAFREEIDVFDNHQVLIEYENGIKVSYMECHYTPDDNRQYVFIGTRGKITLDDARDTITVEIRYGMNDRKEIVTYNNLQSAEGHGGGDKQILDDFIYALKEGKQPNASGEAGLEAIEIGLMAHQSIDENRII